MFQGYDEQCTPPSEGDLLDSELVRAALENLGLEEEELQYRVNIMDYETGTNHKLEVTSVNLLLIVNERSLMLLDNCLVILFILCLKESVSTVYSGSGKEAFP